MNFIKQLSHVSILSKDLRKVKKFYSKILKLKIIHKFINPKTKQVYGFFFRAGKNTMLEFFLTKNKSIKDSNIRHFCFEVKNIKSFSEKLKKKRL
jgi:catechol 2,3-dioxygenase-like lactoylglutathione lyase family enzyme